MNPKTLITDTYKKVGRLVGGGGRVGRDSILYKWNLILLTLSLENSILYYFKHISQMFQSNRDKGILIKPPVKSDYDLAQCYILSLTNVVEK